MSAPAAGEIWTNTSALRYVWSNTNPPILTPTKAAALKERAEAKKSTFIWLASVFCAGLREAHFHPVQVFQLFKAQHSALFNREPSDCISPTLLLLYLKTTAFL